MKTFKRVTLQDVAKEAHVSYASVSAVLNGKDGKSIRVGTQTKEKILECAERLGYVPNMAARKLKSGSTSLIAVFTYEPMFPVESENEYYRFFVGIQETAEKYGYDILILNNRPTEENSSRIALADGAVMMGVNRDDKGIERLVKAHFPLVFVGRREVAGAHTHWVTFAYQEVIEEMVDHLARICRKQSLVYVETKEQEWEPRKDKRSFLLAAAQKQGITVHVVEADEHYRLSQNDFNLIKECQVAVFDRIFLLDPFERDLERMQMKLGRDVWGAVLEDDWLGGHGHWTRWSNQRLELGSLAVEYLSQLLGKCLLEGARKFTPLHLVLSESSSFPE
ncbi:LacI family transcriptional regulator [Sphaerochaeta halotolerans]|jgi:DNA-binding LacI/PurR family transcriptional regulator|uniref:LacI family transcriptional regulator n=1 Tax=Sphaerochaeta halotolerans TaxID=2293840 RepID=A0A372MFJ8_9SPIR|nr:LacI family DNA-binding transcriptional regulator [Sphaerochaeta halotolerans]RFU94076.1 LacI family transcriptional regulator [Sphaerochaeta halotolerans]